MGALTPPADFARWTIPVVPPDPKLAGKYLRLAHIARPDPVDWDGRPGETRFVSPKGGYSVLYLAPDKPTAFWEVFAARLIPLEPEDRILPPAKLRERHWVNLQVPTDLALFDATNIKAVRDIGGTNMSFRGGWDITQQWGDALFHHPQNIDGIIYASDKNDEKCLAVFQRGARPADAITGAFGSLMADDPGFLTEMRAEIRIA